MRRDRCVLAALALVLAALLIGQHTYEHHGHASSAGLSTLEQQTQEQQLRASIFDDLEGYGRKEGSSASNVSQIAEVKRAHEQALQALRSDIAQRNAQLERLTGELDTLRIAHVKQSEQLARNNDAAVAPTVSSIAPAVQVSTTPCDVSGIFVGEDIVGNDISDSVATDARGCCQRCARHQRGGGSCLGWTFAAGGGVEASGGRCYLKSTASLRRPHPSVTSGTVDCCDGIEPADKNSAIPAFLPSAGQGSSTALIANEICVMSTWWGGVRVQGEQLSATKTTSSEQCCTLCASALPPGACVAWTFNTADHHCQSFRLVTSSDKCNVCISGRVSGDDGAPEGLLNEIDPHTLPGTAQHLYARAVLQEALAEGQRLQDAAGVSANQKRDRRDIVIVAAWRRPAFLLRTLAHLMRAADGADQFYLVLLDLHSSPAVEEVAAALPVSHLLLRMPPHFFMQAGWGNSYSLLEGYRYARSLYAQLDSQLVYLVEEDVFVAQDFFKYHSAAHGVEGKRVAGVDLKGTGKAVSLCSRYKAEFCVKTTETLDRHRVFAVLAFNKDLIGETAEAKLEPCRRFVANRLAAGKRPPASDPEGLAAVSMLYARPVFASIGLSVGREALDLIVSLAQPEYYENPEGFIAKRFYGGNMSSTMVGSHDLVHTYGTPRQWTEQDGVINRLMIEHEAVSLLPRCPRAFHAGFVGYNRKHETSNDLSGTSLESRYKELAALSADEMAARSSVADVVATPLEGYFAEELRYCSNMKTTKLECSRSTVP